MVSGVIPATFSVIRAMMKQPKRKLSLPPAGVGVDRTSVDGRFSD